MLKISFLVLLAISLIPVSAAFAEGTIELNSDQDNIQSTDTILVYGKVTGVTSFIPVKLSVVAPDGEVVFSPEISSPPTTFLSPVPGAATSVSFTRDVPVTVNCTLAESATSS